MDGDRNVGRCRWKNWQVKSEKKKKKNWKNLVCFLSHHSLSTAAPCFPCVNLAPSRHREITFKLLSYSICFSIRKLCCVISYLSGKQGIFINIIAIVDSTYQSNSLSILLLIPEQFIEWQKRSSTQSSAPKATILFFPKFMSAQDCEHEHIQLKHIEQRFDKIQCRKKIQSKQIRLIQ